MANGRPNSRAQEEDSSPHENEESHLHGGFFVDLGNKIGGRDVNRNSGGERQSRAHVVAEQRHRKNARKGGCAQYYRRAPGCAPAAAAGQHHGTHGKPLGNLVQKNRQKDQPPQPVRYQKSRGDGDPVEKCMNDEAEQYGVSLVRVHELVAMGFFAKVEVRRNRMLEEVNDQIAQQHKKRG